MPPELYTVGSVAKMFDVKPYTVRRWLEEGKFPNAFKLNGTRWRIPKKDLEALANQEYGA